MTLNVVNRGPGPAVYVDIRWVREMHRPNPGRDPLPVDERPRLSQRLDRIDPKTLALGQATPVRLRIPWTPLEDHWDEPDRDDDIPVWLQRQGEIIVRYQDIYGRSGVMSPELWRLAGPRDVYVCLEYERRSEYAPPGMEPWRYEEDEP